MTTVVITQLSCIYTHTADQLLVPQQTRVHEPVSVNGLHYHSTQGEITGHIISTAEMHTETHCIPYYKVNMKLLGPEYMYMYTQQQRKQARHFCIT